jgi:hypothetical protein
MKNKYYARMLILPLALALTARAFQSPGETPAAIAQSKDVAFLERIAGSLEAAQDFVSINIPSPLYGQTPPDIRCACYCRLGEIGSPEALAAIARLETQAAKVSLTPASLPLSLTPSAVDGRMGTKARLLASVEAPDHTTYALMLDYVFEGSDVFLVSSKTPADLKSWTRPVLAPNTIINGQATVIADAKATLKFLPPDSLRFDFTTPPNFGSSPSNLTCSLADVLRDSDHDGWTDQEEARLGLDPKNPDTDGDGIPDGQDTCPDFAVLADAAKDVQNQILQRAVFVAFGFTGSRSLLVVDPPSAKIAAFGYTGPILYHYDPHKTQPGTQSQQPQPPQQLIRVSWGITSQTDDTAEVRVRATGKLFNPITHVVSLRRINGQWIVTLRKTLGIG